MIVNREQTTVVSSLGWVDGDAIWVCDVESGKARTIPQNTGARYTSLHASDSEREGRQNRDGSRTKPLSFRTAMFSPGTGRPVLCYGAAWNQ